MLKPSQSQEQEVSTYVKFIFVLGEDSFSDTFELGVLDEHPKALESITSHPCLSLLAFLKPAIQAVIARLLPSIIVQIAVRLTALMLRLVALILLTEKHLQSRGVCREEEEQLLKAL